MKRTFASFSAQNERVQRAIEDAEERADGFVDFMNGSIVSGQVQVLFDPQERLYTAIVTVTIDYNPDQVDQ